MYSLAYIADQVGGKVNGNPDYQLSRLSSLDNANSESITFLSNRKFRSKLASCQAGAVILREADGGVFNGNMIFVDDPQLAYAKVSQLFEKQALTGGLEFESNIHPTAVIAASATVHQSAKVGANTVIGERTEVGPGTRIGCNVSIAEDCSVDGETIIFDGVNINPNTRIGSRCRISSGVVIGASGFGYSRDTEGRWHRINQSGGVLIGNDVDIGAGTTIDCGAIDDTKIEDGVKIDNLVMIAHNVHIGENSILAGGTGIAGSTSVGNRCIFGGRSNVNGQITIADDVMINSLTNVMKSVTESGHYSSVWTAKSADKWKDYLVAFSRLPKLLERIKKLEQAVFKNNDS